MGLQERPKNQGGGLLKGSSRQGAVVEAHPENLHRRFVGLLHFSITDYKSLSAKALLSL